MAIVAGVGVPLIMFLAWDAVILGSLPPGGSAGKDPLLLLSQSSDLVGPLIQVRSSACTVCILDGLFCMICLEFISCQL